MCPVVAIVMMLVGPAELFSQTPPAPYPVDPDFNVNLYITPADYAGCAVFDDG